MFTHLHVHTEYSLLDGAARIDDLVKAAVQRKMSSLAITDHGVMYGVIDFYKSCLKHEIKPIIGCEIYLAPGKRTEKTSGKDDKNHHLVLLAENNEGYRNLVKIVSQAHIDGFYYKPRADKELLREYSNGLIALSGCLAGEIPDYLMQDNFSRAEKTALEFSSIFGKDSFYLEMQDHGLADQQKVNNGLWELNRKTGIPIVATNDVHYVRKEDAFIQDVLLCIQTGKNFTDTSRMSFEGQEFFLKNMEEMSLLFRQHPEVLSISNEIAERCKVDFDFGRHYLPDYKVPEGYSLDEYLRELCWKSFATAYPNSLAEEKERLEYELKVITQTGFSGYFLIVADFCNYAREQGVTVGPGRGSAAASMVAYLLGITSVEPLRHNLLFERFLNPERVSLPDIDIDFDPEGREKVIRYVTEKYGEDKVCQIITFGTMGAKGAIRDVGRVLNIPLGKVDKIAKAIPNELGMTLEKALLVSPELQNLLAEEDEYQKLYDIAKSLEGIARHASTHAAGVVIAKDSLTNYLPLQKSADGFLMTQFPMKTVEDIGLLKMDFLGLRNLTIVSKALETIRINRGERINLEQLPLDDELTYRLLAEGNSTGVFQLESGGMRAILKDLKPNRFEDIIAVLALYRPGPMEQIPEFVRRKHGAKVSFSHPAMEDILESTYGIIVYQEQVMQIAQKLGGYSLGRADLLRRAMGKKDKKTMDEERKNFLNGLQDDNGEWIVPGAIRLGVDENIAEEIFNLMAKFAEYGFNKGHATAYAMISYQTAYLKANYPLEFTASLLSSVIGSSDKVSFYIQEARSSGIEILPPDVQYSYHDFTIENKALRFGLKAIRNVGGQVVDKIIRERVNGPFLSFYDFVLRIDSRFMNKRTLESLIKAGAFQSLCTRAQAMRVLDKALELAHYRQRDNESGQISLFEMDQNLDKGIEMPDIDDFEQDEILKMEKEYIGIYLTSHPLFSVNHYLKNLISSDIIACLESTEEKKVILGGIITSYKQTITKKGEMMATFQLEDLTGTIEVLIFPRLFSQTANLDNDKIVIVNGRYYINEEEKKIFAEKISLIEDSMVSAQVAATTEEAKKEVEYEIKGEVKEEGEGVREEAKEYVTSQAKLYIKINSIGDKNFIGRILNTLASYRGDTQVYFFHKEESKLFEVSASYSVRYSPELEQDLSALVGKENIKWQ